MSSEAMRSAGRYSAEPGDYWWDLDPRSIPPEALAASELRVPAPDSSRLLEKVEVQPDPTRSYGGGEYRLPEQGLGFGWTSGALALLEERAQLEMPPEMTIDYGEQQWQQ